VIRQTFQRKGYHTVRTEHPYVFTEEGFPPYPKGIWLTDEEFARGASKFVYCCVDVAFWHRHPDSDGVILDLARRRIIPACGEWWVFGGAMKVGETIEGAALWHLKEDTGLEVDPDRLVLLDPRPRQYRWANGKGGLPNHVFVDIFALEVSPQEIADASAHLDSGEYELNSGIRAFGRPGGLHPAMLRVYDEIDQFFGKR